jgi:hypothetical protein
MKALEPSTILAAQIDPLATEDRLYAEKFRKEGEKVDHKMYFCA